MKERKKKSKISRLIEERKRVRVLLGEKPGKNDLLGQYQWTAKQNVFVTLRMWKMDGKGFYDGARIKEVIRYKPIHYVYAEGVHLEVKFSRKKVLRLCVLSRGEEKAQELLQKGIHLLLIDFIATQEETSAKLEELINKWLSKP